MLSTIASWLAAAIVSLHLGNGAAMISGAAGVHAAHCNSGVAASFSTSVPSDEKGPRTTDSARFQPADGRFSIQMPQGFTDPVESDMPIKSAVGELNMKLYTSMLDEHTVLLISYTDYPEPAAKSEPKILLHGARDGAMRSLQATILNQKEGAANGTSSLSVLFTGSSSGRKTFGRVDYYYAEPRLYTVLLLTPRRNTISSQPISKSFASFTVTPAPSASDH